MSDEQEPTTESNVIPFRKPIEMGERTIVQVDKWCAHDGVILHRNKRELRCNACGMLMCPYEYIDRTMVREEGRYLHLIKERDLLTREINVLKIQRARHKNSVKGFEKRAANKKPCKPVLVGGSG